MLVNVSVPLADPLELGAKVTVNDADPPAARLSGKLIPLTVNSGLSLETPVT